MSSNDLIPRIKKAVELLAVETKILALLLEKSSISNDSIGIIVPEAKTTTIDDLVEVLGKLSGEISKLKIKTAAGILKSGCEVEPIPEVKPVSEAALIAQTLKVNRPIEQWNDEDLLLRFIKDREYEVEQELHRRSKQNRFIVLTPSDEGYLPGKEIIDFERSLGLLKDSRKKTIPSMVSDLGMVRPVFFITGISVKDRITELCPLCGGTLYEGYCEYCQVDFSSVGDDARAYVSLVKELGNFNLKSASDRKALIVSAMKGLNNLRSEWPSQSQKFDELKATQSLPQIRIIASRPSKRRDDPFYNNGVRPVGNKEF